MFQVRDLMVKYQAKVVFSKLSFELADNTILAVLGPSGSGKTSLLNAIIWFIKSPQSFHREDIIVLSLWIKILLS